MYMDSSQMARLNLWLSKKVISGCTVLFGTRIIISSKEETFGNLLIRGGQVFGESEKEENNWACGFFSFFPATRLYLVIKLAQATTH